MIFYLDNKCKRRGRILHNINTETKNILTKKKRERKQETENDESIHHL